MEKKPDRRVARTRAALMKAFVGEMLGRGYEAVSVEDIARRADVGRSTFYMHYSSKDALLREAVSRPSGILSVIVGGNIDPDMVAPQLVHFHEQRTRNGTFFRDPIRRIWVERLAEMTEPRLAKLARQAQANPRLPLPLVAVQLAELQLSLITNWLTRKPALKPEAVAEALIASTHGQVRALLGLDADTSVFLSREKLRVVYRQP
jgi:AcrR family transcriptional regulator